MKAKWTAIGIILLIAVGALGFYGYQEWHGTGIGGRESLLALMPSDATAVIYVDAQDLRTAPFISALYAWAPKPQVDPDYAQFVNATGFDYERDLDRIAIAVQKRGAESILFAVADGRFDRPKIAGYAAKTESVAKYNGHDIYMVPLNDGTRRISFTFLSGGRLAITEGTNAEDLLAKPKQDADAAEWRTHFARLAGSPFFAAVRQDAATGSALAAQAPGGLRSPQLATLLDQLQWITLAAKPQDNGLRVVADGECTSENTVKQLTDMLNGIVQLAQIGLNDPKTRQQLAPAAREAYLEILHSADVSKVDRGNTQSVRVMLDITPKFLEAAHSPVEIIPAPAPPSKAAPPTTKSRRK